MAGLIKREDIDEVRQRTDIKDIVDGYVTLKSAGIGSFKGLSRSMTSALRPSMCARRWGPTTASAAGRAGT